MRKIVVSALSILAILVVALGVAGIVIVLRPDPPRLDTMPPATVVGVELIERRDVVERVHGFGQIRALQRADIAAEVMGRVVWVSEKLEVGVALKSGTELARIDRQAFELALSGAEALLAATRSELEQLAVDEKALAKLVTQTAEQRRLSEDELKRLENLTGTAAPSASELDAQRMIVATHRATDLERRRQLDLIPARRGTLEQRVKSQSSAVERARLDLDHTTIVAPFDGSLSAVFAEVGEVVTIGEPLATIVSPDGIEAEVRIPASQGSSVRVGAPAEVYLEADRSRSATGRVVRLAPEVDSRSRTRGCYVALESGPAGSSGDGNGGGASLQPGAFVRCEIPGATYSAVIAVPREAFIDDTVFIAREESAEDDTPEFRARAVEPTVLRSLPGVVIVGDGIAERDRVIVTNLETLFEGLRVVTEDVSPAKE